MLTCTRRAFSQPTLLLRRWCSHNGPLDVVADSKLAVLIDAENTPARLAQSLMNEVSKYGVPVIKRAYGDFSKPNLVGWKQTAIRLAIGTEQQFSYTSGKNSTDIRLAIDAMDILHSPMYQIDDFVLVSSDSDFAPLASRLRMAGKGRVFGAGDSKTPDGFKSSVDKFIILTGGTDRRDMSLAGSIRSEADHKKLVALLVDIVEDLASSPEDNIRLSGLSESQDDGDAHQGLVYVRSLARLVGRRMVDFKPEQFTRFQAPGQPPPRFLEILQSLSGQFELISKPPDLHSSGSRRHWVVRLKKGESLQADQKTTEPEAPSEEALQQADPQL